MKKLLIMLLAALMILSSAAIAEQTPTVVFQDEDVSFDVTMIIPDGYTPEQSQEGRYLHIHLLPDDTAKAEYSVSVAYSELSDGQTINDMSLDDVRTILSFVELDYAAPQVTETFTKEGTRIYLVDETGGDSDYMTAVTLYKGYFVTVEIHMPDFSQLTEADADLAIELLGDMQLVEKE